MVYAGLLAFLAVTQFACCLGILLESAVGVKNSTSEGIYGFVFYLILPVGLGFAVFPRIADFFPKVGQRLHRIFWALWVVEPALFLACLSHDRLFHWLASAFGVNSTIIAGSTGTGTVIYELALTSLMIVAWGALVKEWSAQPSGRPCEN
jgi:hypothetical protein